VDVTLAQAVSVARDISFVAGVLVMGYKVRGWIQPAVEFFSDARKFMTDMDVSVKKIDGAVNLLLTNHLTHVDQKLDKIIEITVQANKDRRDIGE
jgi:hypothetical protein